MYPQAAGKRQPRRSIRGQRGVYVVLGVDCGVRLADPVRVSDGQRGRKPRDPLPNPVT